MPDDKPVILLDTRISLAVPKGTLERVKAVAKHRGVSEFLRRAVEKALREAERMVVKEAR